MTAAAAVMVTDCPFRVIAAPPTPSPSPRQQELATEIPAIAPAEATVKAARLRRAATMVATTAATIVKVSAVSRATPRRSEVSASALRSRQNTPGAVYVPKP